MKIIINRLLPKSTINLEAGEYLENFFVSAIFSVFAIRAFLSLTDYPQIESGGLHIAHMLWGGFLMMITIIILLSFLSKGVKFISTLSIGVIVIFGLYQQGKRNILSAYKLFKRAIMIDIFLGQFFLFYREGLSSYLHLIIGITIFFSLQYLISQEKLIQKVS